MPATLKARLERLHSLEELVGALDVKVAETEFNDAKVRILREFYAQNQLAYAVAEGKDTYKARIEFIEEKYDTFGKKILMPKKVPTNCAIAQAAKTTTNPTKAWVILFLAFSVLVLSPPDKIHSIPPQTRKKKKIKAAATSIIRKKAETISANVNSETVPPIAPPGFKLIVSAKSFIVRIHYLNSFRNLSTMLLNFLNQYWML